MSQHKLSRTDFASRQSVPFASDLLAQIATDSKLTHRQIVDRSSAIRCLCKALGKAPDCTPIFALKNGAASLSPAQCGVSQRTFENYQSQVRQALFGISPNLLNTRAIKMAPEWQQLFDVVDDPHVKKGCGRFARWATRHGILPFSVDQASADRYAADLIDRLLSRSSRQPVISFCKSWNEAMKRFPDAWPKQRLDPGDRRQTYALPIANVDQCFVDDMDKMLAAFGNPLALPNGFDAPYAKSTLIEMRRIYVRMYSIAVSGGCSVASLSDMVAAPVAELILQHYLEKFSKENTKSAHKYAHFLYIAAKFWVRSEPEALKTLHRYRKNTKPKNTGMTASNRAMVRFFEDDKLVAKLLHQGEKAIEKFKRLKQPKLRDALQLQIAVAIDILTAAPVRPQNLASIDLEKHLVRYASKASPKYHLVFNADEVKNDLDLEFKLPTRVQKILELYVNYALPIISAKGNTQLFPGQKIGPKGPGLLSKQIAARSLRVLGVRVTGHRFRHLVGYIYLKDNPSGHEAVRRFLGHKSIMTTLNHYAGMEQAAGIALVQEHFERKYRVLSDNRTNKSKKLRSTKPL
jgi:integrase